MKYGHLLHAFYGEPWHLRGEEFRSFDALLQRALAGQEVSGPVLSPRAFLPEALQAVTVPGQRRVVGPVDQETGLPLVPQMQVVGDVGVIPIRGALGKGLSTLALMCGGVDYAHVCEFVEQAREDAAITQVLLAIDSPGGAAAGMVDCAMAIRDLGLEKPVVAFTDGKCASAAYGLASQAEMILAESSAIVGSIGTILAAVDDSKAWEMAGERLELFVSSPLKATGWSGKAWTEEDRDYLRERMEQADARFKSVVMQGRAGLKKEAMDGRWFYAENSVELGVVDGIVRGIAEVLREII